MDMDSDKQAEPTLGYGMLHGVTDPVLPSLDLSYPILSVRDWK